MMSWEWLPRDRPTDPYHISSLRGGSKVQNKEPLLLSDELDCAEDCEDCEDLDWKLNNHGMHFGMDWTWDWNLQYKLQVCVL